MVFIKYIKGQKDVTDVAVRKKLKKVLTNQVYSAIMVKVTNFCRVKIQFAGVVQWLEFQPSKLAVWVRFPSPAPYFFNTRL